MPGRTGCVNRGSSWTAQALSEGEVVEGPATIWHHSVAIPPKHLLAVFLSESEKDLWDKGTIQTIMLPWRTKSFALYDHLDQTVQTFLPIEHKRGLLDSCLLLTQDTHFVDYLVYRTIWVLIFVWKWGKASTYLCCAIWPGKFTTYCQIHPCFGISSLK